MKHRNKRKERTEALKEAQKRFLLGEMAENVIMLHRFNKLIEQGVIVEVK